MTNYEKMAELKRTDREESKMNTPCKNCRALELTDSGIRKGNIITFKVHEPRYNCALNQRIILIDGNPHCDGVCKDKTIRRRKNESK